MSNDSSPHNLLSTKVQIPPARASRVPRPRLTARVDEGLQHTLTLISATAGFGKTTLLEDWRQTLTGRQWPLAWLSLDAGDSDWPRFWSYVIAALQTIAPNSGKSVILSLQALPLPDFAAASDEPTRRESILIALLNDLAVLPQDLVLVLDDYHVITSPLIHQSLAFFIDRLPGRLRVVIATREDPPLPLARWRARDQLFEIRAADLQFTLAETAAFFNDVMRVPVSEADVRVLEARTEGWIAGLQMAALSMREHARAADFVASFTGSHRFILDYLVEEVLRGQPPEVQSFLLHTAILDQMTAALCEAVTGRADSQALLERLDTANLFVVPLDHEKRWYRYHHLFAELLRHRLSLSRSSEIAALHQRASVWYEQTADLFNAISHAIAAKDWGRAAELVERAFRSMWLRGEISTLRDWLESFPAEMRRARLTLELVYAWTLTLTNQLDRAEQHLDQVTPLAQITSPILGELIAIRAMIAAYRSDMPAVIELSQQAMRLISPEDAFLRSTIMLSLGFAHDDVSGDIVAAKRAFGDAFALGKILTLDRPADNNPIALTALAQLAELEWLQGHLRVGFGMYDQALKMAEQWGGQSFVAISRVHWGRAMLLYEQNDLDEAECSVQESIRIGELWKQPRLLVHGFGLAAMVRQARGNVDDARAMLRRAEQITHDSYTPPPILGSLALYQLVVWTANNDFQSITRWIGDHGPDWQSTIGRVRDILAIVLARALIAKYHQQPHDQALSQARELIEPALEQAQASGLVFNVVRLLTLQALALHAQNDTGRSIEVLKRALTLAEPENYVRSFLDIGRPLEELLVWSMRSQSLKEARLRVYASSLLAYFGATYPIEPRQDADPTVEKLVEPLTERELDVLRLVATGASDQQIADTLVLSKATVKTHLRSIYGKLLVGNRTRAVARARALNLLP